MTPDTIFLVATQLATVSWLLLLVLPRRRVIVDRLAGAVAPGILAATYALMIGIAWPAASGDFGSLAGVRALFDSEWLLLAGWLHYLAFDLLVGRWELIDSQARGIPHLLMVPCLLLTFLFGPAGWLLYLLVRAVWSRRG